MSATSILRKPSKDPAKNESASSSVEHPSASEARSGTNAPEDENTEEKDIPSPTRPVERRVSFDPTTKAPNNEIGIQKPVLTSRRHSRSARVGKADPIRDFGILSAIFLLLYFVSSGFNNILSNDDGEMVTGGDNKMSSMQTLEMALAQMLEARQKKYPINDDCALFYAPSSIPKTGWGVFAGKNLTSGVKLMTDQSGTRWSFQNQEKQTVYSVVPWSLLLKHHPTVMNIKPSQQLWQAASDEESNEVSFATTRDIARGEELLLSLDDHLHSALPHMFDGVVPVLDDYEEATILIQQARKTFREDKRRGKAKNKQTGHVGQALMMVQKVVARYRPAAAALMPVALESLNKYRGRADDFAALYLGLRNQTVPILLRHGHCFTNVELRPSGDAEDDTTPGSLVPTVGRSFAAEKMVHSIPVYFRAIPQSEQVCHDENGCTSLNQDGCFTRPGGLVQLCLMETDSFQLVTDSKEATVRPQWAKVQSNAPAITEMDMLEIVDKPNTVALLELIAVGDMASGDKVTLSFETGKGTNEWIVPDELFGKKWYA